MENRIVNHLILSNLMVLFIFSGLAIYIEDATFDRDPVTGLFGWMHKKNMFINVVLYGGLNTFWGNVGYILSMHFFSPIVVMNALLIEPFFA